MSDDDFLSGSIFGAGIMGTLAFFVGVCVCNTTIASYKDDAVSAGHAEYYLDDKHERQWRWLPVQKEGGAK